MIQDKGSGQFFAAKGWDVAFTAAPTARDKFLVNNPNYMVNDPNGIQDGSDVTAVTAGMLPRPPVAIGGTVTRGIMTLTVTPDTALDLPAGAVLYAYGRYNSESDFEGNYLGEVEIFWKN